MDGPATGTVMETDDAVNGQDEQQLTRYAQRREVGKRPASIEFPEELYNRLSDRSKFEERSMAAIARQAVKEYLERVGG